MPIKRYYTLMEAQIATGISQWSWREWAQAGKVDFTRGGRRRILIPVTEIERVMKQGYQARKERQDGTIKVQTEDSNSGGEGS